MTAVKVVVAGLTADGDGWAALPPPTEGRVASFSGVLPGDELEIEIEPGRPPCLRGILTPSRDRIKPDCPFHGPCGGCDLLELSEKARRRAKSDIVARTATRITGATSAEQLAPPPTFKPFLWSSSSIRYRPRVRLHQSRTRNVQEAGFLPSSHWPEKMPYGIVPVTSCALLVKPLNQRLVAARRALGHFPHPVEVLQLIASSEGPEKVTGHLTLKPGVPPRGVVAEIEALQRACNLDGISVGGPDGLVKTVVGSVSVPGLVAPGAPGGPYDAEPAFFAQGNVLQASRLLATVMEACGITPNIRIVEGFAGAGNFSFALAAAGARVEAIEEHPGAVRAAERNRRRSPFADRLIVYPGSVEDVLPTLAPEPAVFLLNPPRDGMPGLKKWITRLAPGRVVYVSCSPDALARDGQALVKAGYRLREVTGLDLYPRTHHVEAVAVFTPVGL